jgi:mannose-1-phosphate guanylyltransferase
LLELTAKNRVARFREKSESAGAGVINAGVYLFDASSRETLSVMKGPSLERDVFEKLPPGTIHAFAGAFAFADIGTPESLAAAESVLS